MDNCPECRHEIKLHANESCLLCNCDRSAFPIPGGIPRQVGLYYGDPGAGKTTAVFSFVNRYPSQTFHYLRADRDSTKLFRHFPSHHFDNLIQYDATGDFSAIAKAVLDIAHLVEATGNESEHWVIYDTITRIYKKTRDSYTMARYGRSAEEVIASRQIQRGKAQATNNTVPFEASGNINGFQSWEWDIIRNRFYADIINPILYGLPKTHVIYLAHAVPFEDRGPNGPFVRAEPTKLQGTTGRFRATGQLPDVHPAMSGAVDSILHFSLQSDKHIHQFFTVKETAANWIDEPVPFLNFANEYGRLVIDGEVERLG